MRVPAIVVLSVVLSVSSAYAQLKTAKLFADHMVLQRNKPIPVWGWANKGDKVSVAFNNIKISATAGAGGKWMATLPAMPAGGPYQLKVSAKKQQLLYTDVMVGEVWICSGQSNMEFRLQDAYNYRREQMISPALPIRQFNVKKEAAVTPVADLSEGQWVPLSPQTVGNFTAVGYFFAKELANKLHVTVGLINDNWGGSQVEGWISKNAMLQSPDLKEYGAHAPETWQQADSLLLQKLKHDLHLDAPDAQKIDKATMLQANDSYFKTWMPYSPPSQWDWQGIWAYRGDGYMEHTTELNPYQAAQASTLSIGDNDGHFELYINGKLVKEGEGKEARVIALPAGTWQTGSNIILLHQAQQKSEPWFGQGLHGQASDLYLKFSDETLSLADNKWRSMPDFASDWHYAHIQNNAGAVLYNSMVHPLVPYAIKGVIWYQGEANTDRAYQYRSTFPLMIQSWREEWKDNFPFLFVQLASFGGQQNSNQGSGWAELREAQTMALALPNTGMAITTDVGDPFNIHPRNKEDVGKRLAATALYNSYNIKTAEYSGPVYQSAIFKYGKATISFTHADSGLVVKNKYGYLMGFEIAGADKVFHYASATIANDKVTVWSEEVPNPVAVRYGWADAPIDANLYNKQGFPAGPFRTDDWAGVTVGKGFR
nr:sialate O-acetylesterase [uncultured Mucilaginibacter sp.]